MRTRYQYRILICDQRDYVFQRIQANLPSEAEVTFEVQWSTSQAEALNLLASPQWDLAFCGLPEGAESELAFLRLCIQQTPELPLIFLMEQAEPDLATQAQQTGAADYLTLDETGSPLLARAVRYLVDRHSWESKRGQMLPGQMLPEQMMLEQMTPGQKVPEQTAPEQMVLDLNLPQQKPPEPRLTGEINPHNFELLSQIREAILGLDQDFTLIAWNHAAEELYGWTANEVLGHKLFDIIRFEAPRAKIAKALSSFVRSGTYQIEAAQYRKDGSKIDVISSVSALFGAKGQIEGYILQNRDVSEQKRAEEERAQILINLRNTRLRAELMTIEARQRANEMEAIFESLVDAVLIYGTDAKPTRANRAAIEILGYDPTGGDWERLSGLTQLFDQQGQLIEVNDQPHYRALRGESTTSARLHLTNPQGERYSLLVSCSTLYTNGQISGAVAVYHDNTEQDALIRNLEAERSRLSTIFANMPEGIVLTDPQGSILLSNPPANQDFFQALFRSNHDEFVVLQPNGTPFTQDDLPLHRSVTLGEAHINLEMAVTRRDLLTGQPQQTRYFLVNTAPIIDRKGQITGALGVFWDITQRKQTEEEIRRQMSLTEIQHYLTQYRDQEHLNIAHDLHDGPLQEMIGLSFKINALMYKIENEAQHQEISAAYDLAQSLIKEVRAYCNDLRPPTLGRYGLDKTIQSYTAKLRIQYPDIQFHLDLKLRHFLTNEARIALFRIYKELIHNVVRHSEATQVYVRLESTDQGIEMEVQDNGVGFDMPADWVELARRGHLGLVGVRERAESIGGETEVFSSQAEGTKVLIRAPAQPGVPALI